jgi:hypothetical protein
MTDPLEYPRSVFARLPGLREEPPAVRDIVLDILDAVFFASMMPEEGELVPIGVVVDLDDRLEETRNGDASADPYADQRAWFVWRIDPLPLSPRTLKRLAHGVQYGRDLVVVTKRESGLVITGVARRRTFTDGGEVLRIAAPRPGVLVLEGKNRQLGARYEAGRELPNDIEVFEEEGPVLEALRACQLGPYCWTLAEVLRHARSSRDGAMFLCLPTPSARELHGTLTYRFLDPSVVERLTTQQRSLFFQGVALAKVDGRVDAEDVEKHAVLENDIELNRASLDAIIEMVGRLAANDGAVVIEPGFQVVGAGCILETMEGGQGPPRLKVCRDALGKDAVERAPSGGARHTAGYRFAWSTPGAVVFIVSSDGPVTCALRRGDELLTWAVRLSET